MSIASPQDLAQPRHILAVIDDSHGQIALRSALALAERHGATLEVFACVELPHDMGILARLSATGPEAMIETVRAQKHATVQARLEEVAPGRAIPAHIAIGKTFIEIIRHVDRTACDFVIKAAEPLSGVHRFLFSSTDQHLLRKCPCPVWLQTPTATTAPRRVLAAVDLDLWDAEEPETLQDLNRRVIETACAVAAQAEIDTEALVLHAWDAVGEGLVWAFSSDVEARAMADRYVEEIREARERAMAGFMADLQADGRTRPPLRPLLARGTPEEVIEAQARTHHADVVVMGTVARTGLSGVFIGNTAENIINTLGCPVIAVKPAGFVSPLLAASRASGGTA